MEGEQLAPLLWKPSDMKAMQEPVGEACRREGIVFVPMPMETLGGWHDATVLQVKKIASAQARQTGGELSDVTRHL